MSTPLLTWAFPLPRTHAGVPLGNGTVGILVWGDERLHLTIARAGFWDHRDGTPFSTRTTYAKLRRLLEAGDEAGVRAAFASASVRQGPRLLQQHSGARLELAFAGWVPDRATIDAGRGLLTVRFLHQDGRHAGLNLALAMDEELGWAEWDAALGEPAVTLIPAGVIQATDRQARGIAAPETWTDADGGGVLQRLPEDDPLAIAWSRRGQRLALATALGGDARAAATARCRQDTAATAARASAWWADYWRAVPRIALPDPVLQRLVDLGLWKQAGLTTPGGVAATLQGPWMEEYQPPPWSNDYHFNINVQMVYGPCLATNRAQHLEPLWAMLRAWLPELQRNAAAFFGADDALMLPHAVDDRCQVVGSFWAGTIDHGCTAWVALMAWEHYRHTRDRQLLDELAWPLLAGAFGGYWAMLEEIIVDGRPRLSLPVSTSPEYNGSAMNAWGRDASFQLAAAHAVTQALEQAAAVTGRPADPRWARLRAELPPYTRTAGDKPRIALWQGQDLTESHRHHSHLAGLWPFRSYDPTDPAHRAVVAASLDHWVKTGSGAWTGWCIPWAAILCARVGSADAAVAWLHWLHTAYTNGGDGSLHNAVENGMSCFGHAWAFDRPRDRSREIMQADAAMGALWAVCELLVQERGEVLHVLPAIPEKWAELEFDGIRAPGAVLVGATVRRRRIQQVRLRAEQQVRLRLAPGLGERVRLDGVERSAPGGMVELDLPAGATVVLGRA